MVQFGVMSTASDRVVHGPSKINHKNNLKPNCLMKNLGFEEGNVNLMKAVECTTYHDQKYKLY